MNKVTGRIIRMILMGIWLGCGLYLSSVYLLACVPYLGMSCLIAALTGVFDGNLQEEAAK